MQLVQSFLLRLKVFHRFTVKWDTDSLFMIQSPLSKPLRPHEKYINLNYTFIKVYCQFMKVDTTSTHMYCYSPLCCSFKRREISRFASRSAISCRLSNCFLPVTSPTVAFTKPRLKCKFNGTKEYPFSLTCPIKR